MSFLFIRGVVFENRKVPQFKEKTTDKNPNCYCRLHPEKIEKMYRRSKKVRPYIWLERVLTLRKHFS